MTAVSKGRNYEYEVMKIFKEKGYDVQRAAGSHSPFDLICVKYSENASSTVKNKKICFVAFVQCKIKKTD